MICLAPAPRTWSLLLRRQGRRRVYDKVTAVTSELTDSGRKCQEGRPPSGTVPTSRSHGHPDSARLLTVITQHHLHNTVTDLLPII